MADKTRSDKQHTSIPDILFVGLVCEDIICTVSEYPKEDEKIRCASSALRVGGNARNAAVVLSLLNQLHRKTNIYFMASLSSKVRSNFVVSDLQKYGINTNLCVYSDKHDMTVSYIIVSVKSRSRTIINNPCLKALKYEDFIQSISANSIENEHQARPDQLDEDDTKTIEKRSRLLKTIDDALLFVNTYPFMESRYKLLDHIKVIHVEARWIRSMAKILGFIKKKYPNTFISIEIEKERLYDSDDGRFASDHSDNYPVNDLIAFADLVFFSRQLVQERGYTDDTPHVFIKDIMKQYGNNRLHSLTVVVPWGSTGAYGAKYDCTLELYDESHRLHTVDIAFSASCPPKELVETIGAGDTFIGAYLNYALTHDIRKYANNGGLQKCLDYANRVAGYKVGHYGFECVKNLQSQP